MSNTTHGVSFEEYCAATGLLSKKTDINAIFSALQIDAAQWTEICNTYALNVAADMGTYMKYMTNPALSPRLSFVAGGTQQAAGGSFFDNVLKNFNTNADFGAMFANAVGNLDDSEEDDEAADLEMERQFPVPAEKRHLLSMGAIILHQHPVKTFQFYGTTEPLREMLDSMWEIHDHDSAIETLEWLKNEGHRTNLDEDIDVNDEETKEAVEEYKEALNGIAELNIDASGNVSDILAWDTERIASTARYSYGAGYISEAECWQYLQTAYDMTKQQYNDWAKYAGAFMTGRAVCFGSSPYNFAEAIKKLLNNANSIWKEYPLN